MKSPEDRSALERVLASELARSAEADGDCSDAELLAAYYDRSLSKAEHLAFERHVAGCRFCQERLAVVARSESGPPEGPRTAWSLRTLVPLVSSAAAVIFVAWIAMRPGGPASVPSSREPVTSASRPTSATELVLGGGERDAAPTELAQEMSAKPQSAPSPDPPAKRLDSSRYELRDKLAQRDVPERQLGLGRFRSTHEATSDSKQELTDLAATAPARRDEADQRVAEPAPAQPAAPAPPPGPSSSAPSATEKAKKEDMTQVSGSASPGQREFSIALARPGARMVRSPDPQIVWRIEADSGISISRDGEATWTLQVRTPGDTLLTGASPSPSAAWVAGRAGVVWQTGDGAAWRRVPLPVSEDVVTLRAADALHATAVTATGVTYVTSDGGLRWTAQ